MILSAKNIALINLSTQLLLLVAVLTAAYLARIKHKYGIHCPIMRTAVGIQVIMIILVMWPTLVTYIENVPKGAWFNAEILTHHVIGLTILILFILINLYFYGIISLPLKLVTLMRTAFILWMVVIVLGIINFWTIWG